MGSSDQNLDRRGAAWALTFAVLVAIPAGGAEGGGAPDLTRPALVAGSRELAKVSTRLLAARALRREGLTAAELAPEGGPRPALPPIGRRAQVEIRLAVLTPAELAALVGLGVEVAGADPESGVVDAFLDLEQLEAVAALPAVTAIREAAIPWRFAGAALTQGDATMNADGARSTLGEDGSGVLVGLLSDSYNGVPLYQGAVSGTSCSRMVTGKSNQDSSDLPASAILLDDCEQGLDTCLDGDPTNDSNCCFVTDEGAALGETSHDVAPGAAQAFHSAFFSPSSFAGGIGELVACGADVLVDDILFLNEPMFQDGEVALAAQAAVDAGAAYFSAAGNQQTFGIFDDYVDSVPGTDDLTSDPPSGNDLHDFDPGGGGDAFADLIVPGGCTVFAVLQWNEPWGAAASDLDLYVCTGASPTSCLDIGGGGLDRQGCGAGSPPGGGDPLEILGFTASSTSTLFLAVEHHCSPSPAAEDALAFRVATFTSGCAMDDVDWEDGGPGESSIFVDPQIYGHAAARGVVAVAAAFFAEIDDDSAPVGEPIGPPGEWNVEPFSSLGGEISFFYDGSGGPLSAAGPAPADPTAPETRFKPEITGPDGGNTTFFGADIPGDADADPNFFGTSAAAPHAGAVAALVIDAAGMTGSGPMAKSNLSPVAIREILESGALDIEGAGVDPRSGAGFVDALKSVGAVDPDTAMFFLDELVLDLDGGALRNAGVTAAIELRAGTSITFGDGDFSGAEATSPLHIFTDGFESGDTSAWGH